MEHIAPLMEQSLNSRIRMTIKKYRPKQEDFYASSVKIMKKSRILAILLDFKGGISHKQLAEEVAIDRKNLRHYMTQLISEGYAKRDSGKFGLYYPTSKSLNQEVIFDALGEGLRRVLSNGYDCGNHGNIKLQKDCNEAEDRLFKFSNLLGALITYVLMQSVSNINPFLDEKMYKRINSPLVMESIWVEKILSRLISGIALEAEFHERLLPIHTNLRELFRAYKGLYPQIYFEMTRLWDALEEDHRLSPYWQVVS